MQEILTKYDLTSGESEEMEVLIDAWRELNFSDDQIKKELKDYHLNL
ncbi:MAG TPA: hypothetical protein VF868_10620 [Bacteroidia bacterium]